MRADAVRRANSGEKVAAIARDVGVSEASVYGWISQMKRRAENLPVADATPEPEGDEAEPEDGEPEEEELTLEQAVAERDFALAILEQLDVALSPEMLRVLMAAALTVVGEG